ncbi:uncharacterized protein LOC144908685 [Branchiostoma floridae x Branchiostoma belcheri]
MWKELLVCVCAIAYINRGAAVPVNANQQTDSENHSRSKRAVPPFLVAAAKKVGTKIVDALGERIAEAVVENHQEKVVSSLEKYFSGQFDKADAEFDSVLDRTGDLLSGAPAVEEARVQVFHGRGQNTGDTFAPPSEEILMSFKHANKDEQDSSEVWGAVAYSTGLGPVMMNGCFGSNYQPGDPCHGAFVTLDACSNIIDGATFLGVGFDGRGEYSTDSRKKSLIQRYCQRLQRYKKYAVPDTMTVQGIYDTDVETYTFSSMDEYRQYLEEKSAVTSTKAMFQQEIIKAQGHKAGGGPFGLVGSAGGGISFQTGSDSQSSSFTASSQASAQSSATSTRTFMAMMELNVFRYEIFLDFIKPEDLSLSFLRDFLNLPPSYFDIGAQIVFQNFLLRWGTHCITSAKFGGQLKIIKTKVATEQLSMESFSQAAQSDFKKAFSTFSSLQTQTKSSSWFHDSGTKTDLAGSSGSATQETSSSSSASLEETRNRMEFSNEMMMVQGGDQRIACAITEFYTTSFGSTLKKWLESIDEFPKAFEFTMQFITDLLDINFDSLFPSGITDYGCLGGNLLKENGTGKTYYTQDVPVANGTGYITEVRYCNFAKHDEMREGIANKRSALQRAIAVYLEEGPSPSTDLFIPAGAPGCETAELVLLDGSNTGAPSWNIMSTGEEFTVIFDMPANIPNLLFAKDSVHVKHVFNKWLTIRDGFAPHLYDGHDNGDSGDITRKKISVGGLVMSYDEASGYLTVTEDDFDASALVIPDLPAWCKGLTIARAEHLSLLQHFSSHPTEAVGYMPCNIKWSNAHRIDPTDGGKCIHFTAASEGDIFVVFAGVPRDRETWVYLEISPRAVALYRALRLAVTQFERGARGLGSDTLFQSYFVCITENIDGGRTIVQYGKTPDYEKRAHVWLDYQFNDVLSLQYYTFGSGEHPVKIMGISQLDQPPEQLIVCRKGTKKSQGRCVQDCHDECEGCRTTGSDSPRDCIACRNKRVPYPYIDVPISTFECVPDCPSTMALKPGTQDCECIKEMEDITPEGVKTCVTDCPLTHYDDNGICKRCSSLCVDVSASGLSVCTGPDVLNDCTTCKYTTAGGTCVQGCNPGQKATLSASTPSSFNCEPCQPGYRCVNGDEVEEICPAGTYSRADGTDCDPCLAGEYTDTDGASSCNVCPAMYYSQGGSTNCQPCPAGQYSGAGANSCKDCQSAYVHVDGTLSCQICTCPPVGIDGSFQGCCVFVVVGIIPNGPYPDSNTGPILLPADNIASSLQLGK